MMKTKNQTKTEMSTAYKTGTAIGLATCIGRMIELNMTDHSSYMMDQQERRALKPFWSLKEIQDEIVKLQTALNGIADDLTFKRENL